MTDEQIRILAVMRYTDEILDIIENHQEFTTSDLQGAIQGIINRIMDEK